jgi:hypothetical protein
VAGKRGFMSLKEIRMTKISDEDVEEISVMIRGTMQVPNTTSEANGNPDEIPTEIDKRWLSRMRKLSEDSIKSLEEGAKHVMTACTFFITVYAFVMSDASRRSDMVDRTPVVFAAPLVLFASSMVSAVFALLPLRYRTNLVSVTRAKDTWLKIVNDKSRALWIAVSFLILGLFVFTLGLVVYCGG